MAPDVLILKRNDTMVMMWQFCTVPILNLINFGKIDVR